MILFDLIPIDGVTLTIAAVTLFYIYLTSTWDHWKKRNVPYEKPHLFFGNFKDVFLSRTTVGELLQDIYRKYEGKPFVGIWRLREPVLVIRDTELVKTVLLKDFNKFHDNGFRLNKHADPLMGRNPFFQRGNGWKTTRQLLTPNFTNVKLKPLFPLMDDVVKEMVEYINKISATCGPDGIEAKNFASKFTMENVATCAFGVKGNSFKDPKADLLTKTRRILDPGFRKNLEFSLIQFLPTISDFLQLSLVPKDVAKYLSDIINDVVSQREKHNVTRSDYLQNLILLKKKAIENNQGDFSNTDITAHALIFLTDGYETSNIVLSFMLYELARCPEAQEKLREEVDRTLKEHGKFTFELLMEKMPYLHQVLEEVLRLHPPLMQMEKLCTADTTLRAPDGSEVKLEKGRLVIIPVRGLQTDPKHFPDPERFDPDRFAPGRRDSFPRYAFLPFGEGPRMCLGMRFGQVQVKLGISTILHHFEVLTTPKTPDPWKQDPFYFLHAAKGGLWIKFKKRENVP